MLLVILAVILAVVGVAGSVLPGLAGPPLGWVGLLLLYFAPIDDPVSRTTLIVCLVATVAVSVIGYVLPSLMTRVMGGHKAASTGALVGLFAGIFLSPIGMIGGSILGAFLAEFIFEDGGVWNSFKASIGAFLAFIVTTVANLAVSGTILWLILAHVI